MCYVSITENLKTQRCQETQIQGEPSHSILFDTGPDSRSLVRNISSLKVPIEKVERVIISHWHRDHTGGLLSFLELRKSVPTPCIVDVHPDRPIARGIAPGPKYDTVIATLPPDPTFELIEEGGGVLEKHCEGHSVAGGTVWVSGVIPRVTKFEDGILSGVKWVEDDGGKWVSDQVWVALGLIGRRLTEKKYIMDERYVAIDVAGKGLVIFSA